MRFSLKQLFVFVLVLCGVLFLFSVYPNLRLKRIQRETKTLVVLIEKDDDKWSEFQDGAFELSGTIAETFLTKILDSSKLDQARFASKLELHVYSLDENGKCLGEIVFRNDYGYRFDPTNDPLDNSNPLKEFVELAQKGSQIPDDEFEEMRSRSLTGRYRDYEFSVGQN